MVYIWRSDNNFMKLFSPPSLCGFWGLNSDHHWAARPLPIEPSCQPPNNFLKFFSMFWSYFLKNKTTKTTKTNKQEYTSNMNLDCVGQLRLLRGLPCSVVDIPSVTPLDKNDFPFPSRYQLPTAWLGMALCPQKIFLEKKIGKSDESKCPVVINVSAI